MNKSWFTVSHGRVLYKKVKCKKYINTVKTVQTEQSRDFHLTLNLKELILDLKRSNELSAQSEESNQIKKKFPSENEEEQFNILE